MIPARRTLALAALALGAWPVASEAQLTERVVRIAPTLTSYKMSSPDSAASLTQTAVPIFIAFPIGAKASIDIGTAFGASSATVDGRAASINGLTDTQIRGSYALSDNVVITLGINAPTGKATISTSQLEIAGLLGTDLLGNAVPAYGSGLAITGGIAVGRQVGGWNVSGGASVRQATGFAPFDTGSVRFVPGSEYRGSLSGDRELGGGRLAIGMTASTFAGEKFGTTATATGNRYLGQAAWIGSLGEGRPDLVLSGWHLASGTGEYAGTTISSQQVTNLQAAVGFRFGEKTIEPTFEFRRWTAGENQRGTLSLLGVRTRIPVGGLTLFPGAAFGVGSLNHDLGSGAFGGSLTGFRMTLGMARTF
jgi:hypothetical protein